MTKSLPLVGEGHKLAVLGLGGLGHMGVKFGVALGTEVTVLSTSPKKEEDARKLGAHKFTVTNDPAQLKSARGYFDFILDTVSAEHDYNQYLALLKTDGVQPDPRSEKHRRVEHWRHCRNGGNGGFLRGKQHRFWH